MRRKDQYDQLAEEVIFNSAEFRRALEADDDDALSEALADELRKAFGTAPSRLPRTEAT